MLFFILTDFENNKGGKLGKLVKRMGEGEEKRLADIKCTNTIRGNNYCYTAHMFQDTNEKPELLSKAEWELYYRKDKLENMPLNVQANMYLLSLYALPHLCPGYKSFGPSKTSRSLSASVYVTSEAFVLLLAMDGHLDKPQDDDKKKSIVTKKSVKEYIELVERVTRDRGDETGGREWEESIMEMAGKLKEIEEEDRKKRLEDRSKARLDKLSPRKREALEKQRDERQENKKQKLVIPQVTQLPPVWAVTTSSAVSESSLSGGLSGITGVVGETREV